MGNKAEIPMLPADHDASGNGEGNPDPEITRPKPPQGKPVEEPDEPSPEERKLWELPGGRPPPS
jgi:hypothetical protein